MMEINALPVITGLLTMIISLVSYVFYSHVKEDKEKFRQIERELGTVVKYVDYEKHVDTMIKGFEEIKSDFKELREYVNKLLNKAPEYYVTQDNCDTNKEALKMLLFEFKREWQAEKRTLEQGINSLNEKMDKLLITLATKNKK